MKEIFISLKFHMEPTKGDNPPLPKFWYEQTSKMRSQDFITGIVEVELAQESIEDCIKYQIPHNVMIGFPHLLEGCMLTS